MGILKIQLSEITKLETASYSREELGLLYRVTNEKTVLLADNGYSYILNNQGQAFLLGDDDLIRAGLGLERGINGIIPTPKIGQIIAIASYYHCLFLNSEGQVFSLGDNRVGQLGLGDNESRKVPTQIEASEIGRILAIATGSWFSLLLNSEGQVFSFGNNEYGNLGLETEDEQLTPTLIEAPDLGRIVAIAAGSFYSLLLNSEGHVFHFGQIISSDQCNLLPTRIITSDLGRVVAIAANGFHSLFLNSQGQVFSFGRSDNGQLGLGNKEDREIPTLLEYPELGRIIAISAGYFHSLILNSQGQVFAFGSNGNGELGKDYQDSSLVAKCINTPVLIKSPLIGKIVAISAGDHHSLIINTKGQIFGFGINENGQLGLGDIRNRYSPTLIPNLGS
jgi:alpha-tubulin suppressor-like RCC1 family protein